MDTLICLLFEIIKINIVCGQIIMSEKPLKLFCRKCFESKWQILNDESPKSRDVDATCRLED